MKDFRNKYLLFSIFGIFFFLNACSKEEIPVVSVGNYLVSSNNGPDQPVSIVADPDGSYVLSGMAVASPLVISHTNEGNFVPEQVFPRSGMVTGVGCGGCIQIQPYLIKIYGEVKTVSESELAILLSLKTRHQSDDEFGEAISTTYTLIKQ